jgi:hypothetical protein
MFFLRREKPLELAEGLLGLRLSLNAPVVATPDLPVGPAGAAIVVHQELDGRANVTVAVRSLKGGELVLYSLDGDLRGESAVAVAADAALSFAEGMGFLFDEDALAGADAGAGARALGLWREFVGEAEELELTELFELGEPLAESVPAVPAAPVPAEPPRLSKFRHAAPAEAPPSGPRAEAPTAEALVPAGPEERAGPAAGRVAAGLRRAALGRLKLVKRLGDGSEESRSWILKLLSSF